VEELAEKGNRSVSNSIRGTRGSATGPRVIGDEAAWSTTSTAGLMSFAELKDRMNRSHRGYTAELSRQDSIPARKNRA
jgi:hypothetical protein